MQITIQDPSPIVVGSGIFATTRPYYNSSLVAVKVTKPCHYCGNPVTFIRGGVFSGSDSHAECAPKDDGFMKSVLGNMTPAQYQTRYGVAWNE